MYHFYWQAKPLLNQHYVGQMSWQLWVMSYSCFFSLLFSSHYFDIVIVSSSFHWFLSFFPLFCGLLSGSFCFLRFTSCVFTHEVFLTREHVRNIIRSAFTFFTMKILGHSSRRFMLHSLTVNLSFCSFSAHTHFF